MSDADVIVVGGGTSGSVLAARLSEDPERSVLLLEAGPVPRRTADFPTGMLEARTVLGAPGHPDNWSFPAYLTPERPYTIPRGRILGGSSTINGAYFVRARREDFERWSAGGNSAWAFDRVLPLLRQLETDLDFGESAVHGGSGPMLVTRASLEHPAVAAFAGAAAELGIAAESDKNDQGTPGFGAVPTNAIGGVRRNAGLAYILPALPRPNLTVRGDCVVRRIVFRAGRAIAVDVESGGMITRVSGGEIVLSAGSIATPHLLLLSGVGDRRHLEEAGVPVVSNAPSIGRRFSDHPQVVVEWQPAKPLPVPDESWMTASVNISSTNGSPAGDLEILQSAVPMSVLTGAATADPEAPLPFLVSVQTPIQHGRIRLASSNPASPPIIQYNYLSTADDRRRMREAVRATVALIHADAFSPVSTGVVGLPRGDVDDDATLDHWIRERLGTSIHACGSVPFGAAEDRDAAVDQYGRVHGVRGLRVADTSILPTAPLRGPANTAVLIGELVARAIRDDLR